MTIPINILSHDPLLLEKARRIAVDYATSLICDDLVGIVLLGAVARGYFDAAADIDLGVFKKRGSAFDIPDKFRQIEGIEVQVWLADYECELKADWDTARRWTYSQGVIHYDPTGKIQKLLDRKVPLRDDERRWEMMAGCVLAEWYINRLTRTWVERGSLPAAHSMFEHGLDYYYRMLFALNHQLCPDVKWRVFCVERLPRLPEGFTESLCSVLCVKQIDIPELDRRRAAFMSLWNQTLPWIEAELNLSFEQMLALV